MHHFLGTAVIEDVDDLLSKMNEFNVLLGVGEERGVVVEGNRLPHDGMRAVV